MYKLNFNRPFNMSTNVSELLERESKVVNGQAAAGIAPNYQDGAILANDYEFFLYGGLIDQTDQFAPPDADDVLLDRLASYGAEKSAFKSGIGQTKLPENVTRYVTYGGAANAPSENKAWYFGGYRSPSAGPIYTPGGDDDLNPINVSSTLITLDMTTQMDEKWTNVSLPSEIKSRANPELVWVPVGEQGILVVVGGVTFPEYATADKFSKDEAQSVCQYATSSRRLVE